MIEKLLREFADTNKIKNKGALSVMLVFTRKAIDSGLPLDPKAHITTRRGQVAGLNVHSVQSVLNECGITQVLAKEGGRTSRGSLDNMELYLEFLNNLPHQDKETLKQIEAWWIERVREYFAGKPLKIKMDQSKSLHSIIDDLLNQAIKRQKDIKGSTYMGTVIQHLVGAKLELVLPEIDIKHHGASFTDSSTARGGDFHVGDTIIHVTTAPTEALILKCLENIDSGLRPIIITTAEKTSVAWGLAENININQRIEVLDVLQFLATNIYELSGFKQASRPVTFNELVKKYNYIIDNFETDPRLRISLKV